MLAAVLLAALVAFSADQAAVDAAPRARLSPGHGEDFVDPHLARLVIEFDRDMNVDGYSFARIGPSFPELAGDPHWLDARTCELPVSLAAGTIYELGLNGPGLENFRSTAGTPLEPVRWVFRTASEAPTAEPWSDERVAAALAAARSALTTLYSLRNERPAGFVERVGSTKHARPPRSAFEFAASLADELMPSDDPHLMVHGGGYAFPTYVRAAYANWNPGRVIAKLKGPTKRSQQVFHGNFENTFGYVSIASLSGDADHVVVPVDEALEQYRDFEGLVVDLRTNGGGSEPLARRIAARFTSEPRVYAKHRSVDVGAADGFGELVSRVLEPDPARPAWDRPVVVLVGPVTMSSAESLALMLRACGARLVGAPTAGHSGNPQPVEIDAEVVLSLPSWQAYDVAGNPLEGRGVPPDELVEPADASIWRDEDPVFDRAVELLRELAATRAAERSSSDR